MACHHKFENYLQLERLDFDPNTLIVGTFNPSWPKSKGKEAKWLYGRTTRNYFWDVLPRLYGSKSLWKSSHVEWKKFCKDQKIALTDIIMNIKDADENNQTHQDLLSNFEDKSITDNFKDLESIKIVSLFIKYPTIVNVYLTRQAGNKIFDDLWAPVEEYCKHKGMHVQMLLTPSASARFEMGNYKELNPLDPSPLPNFILKNWQQKWHFKNDNPINIDVISASKKLLNEKNISRSLKSKKVLSKPLTTINANHDDADNFLVRTEIILKPAYYNGYFFNIGVDFGEYFGEHDSIVFIYLGRVKQTPIQRRVNRTANNTGAPRIMSGPEIREWIRGNFDLEDYLTIEIIAFNTIRLIEKENVN